MIEKMIVMAKANLRLGRNELAQSILEQALAIDASNAEGHFLRGQMYEAEHQLQPAITSYRRAVELSRDYADARMRLLCVLERHRRQRHGSASSTRAFLDSTMSTCSSSGSERRVTRPDDG